MAESFLTKWEKVIKATPLNLKKVEDDPLEGFVMPPERSEIDRAAAIIAGHDEIMALGEERMVAFHGFVQEVLATTVEPEIERLKFDAAMMKRSDMCHQEEIARQAEEIDRLKAERLILDRRIHNQRVALRQTWEIVEMRAGYKHLPEGVRSRMLEAWCRTSNKLRALGGGDA